MIRNAYLKEYLKAGYHEVHRWPMHLQDSNIIDLINENETLLMNATIFGGLTLITIGGQKSMVVNLSHKSPQSPFYSTIRRGGRHHLSQKDFA